MAAKPLPDVETLRKLLDYDPATGLLIWKERPESMFRRQQDALRWNKINVGKPAGNTRPLPKNYVLVSVLSQNLMAHRIVWALYYGREPSEQIDHVNGDCSDNRIGNLRSTSNQENCRNQSRPRNNTSGVVGVSFEKNIGRWKAYITIGRKRTGLGYFHRLEDAIAARKAAEMQHGYHLNHGR